MLRGILLVLILVTFAAGYWKVQQRPVAAPYYVPPVAVQSDVPQMRSQFSSSTLHTQTHAASLVELSDGRVRAFWFAGSREGAPDVLIRSAIYDPVQQSWSDEETIVGREATQQALHRYVAKIGNPVAGRAADGTLWLYYVTVSLGGWAGGSITAMTSTDDGVTWGAPRRLITSPFINISTLVKGAPYLYADGTMGLPVYHEFISKFGELLRFDSRGTLVDKQRLTKASERGLQPTLAVQSEHDAIVLMRHSGDDHRRAVGVFTHDAGVHWSKPEPTSLPNSDAALALESLPDGMLLAAFNDQEHGRDTLVLAVSEDAGQSWKRVYTLDEVKDAPKDVAGFIAHMTDRARLADTRVADLAGEYADSARRQGCEAQQCRYEFSYPYLLQARNGDIHLVYTWNRSFIRHVVFNRAWLDQQKAGAQ